MGFAGVQDEDKDKGWSPAPVVYGIVNRKLLAFSQKSKFIPIIELNSRPERYGVREGQVEEGKEGAVFFFLASVPRSSRSSAPLPVWGGVSPRQAAVASSSG